MLDWQPSAAEKLTGMTGDSPSAVQLKDVADPFVRELASLGRVRTYPKNSVFITEGDSSDSLFVVLKGKVKVFVSDNEGHAASFEDAVAAALVRARAGS